MKQNLYALLFGLFIILCVILSAELFFFLNARNNWLAQPAQPYLRNRTLLNGFLTAAAKRHVEDVPDRLKRASIRRSAYTLAECGSCASVSPKIDGPLFVPSSRVGVVKTAGSGGIVYNVTYGFDELGNRLTLNQEGPFTHRIIFLGDSFTFGVGVEDSETFESALAELQPNLEILNAGESGTGPNDLLFKLQRGHFKGCAKSDRPTIAVYTFLDFMLDRILVPISTLRASKNIDYTLKPRYSISANGSVEYLGSFAETRGSLNRVYRAIANTYTYDHFKPFWPPPTRKDYRLTARLFHEISNELKTRCGVSATYVSLYPGTAGAITYGVWDALLEEGIPVIDFSSLDSDSVLGDEARIPGDGHPTPLAHYWYAKLLSGELTRPRGPLSD